MGKKIDLTGQRFGRLVVLGESKKRSGGHVCWWCQCDCGELACVQENVLRIGTTKSCGCLRKPHGKSTSAEYKIWASMLQRCNNPKNKAFKHYGGRGISVCERWKDFKNFLKDMGEKPAGYSIERIDNDGDYCQENCEWATRSKQQWNTRRKGYSWKKDCEKWRAEIARNGIKRYLGLFETPEEAKAAYEKAKMDFANSVL